MIPFHQGSILIRQVTFAAAARRSGHRPSTRTHLVPTPSALTTPSSPATLEPVTRTAVNGWAPDHPDDPVPPPDEQIVTTIGKPNVTTYERMVTTRGGRSVNSADESSGRAAHAGLSPGTAGAMQPPGTHLTPHGGTELARIRRRRDGRLAPGAAGQQKSGP